MLRDACEDTDLARSACTFAAGGEDSRARLVDDIEDAAVLRHQEDPAGARELDFERRVGRVFLVAGAKRSSTRSSRRPRSIADVSRAVRSRSGPHAQTAASAHVRSQIVSMSNRPRGGGVPVGTRWSGSHSRLLTVDVAEPVTGTTFTVREISRNRKCGCSTGRSKSMTSGSGKWSESRDPAAYATNRRSPATSLCSPSTVSSVTSRFIPVIADS